MGLVFSISNGPLSESQIAVLKQFIHKKFSGVTYIQNDWTYLHLASWHGNSTVVSEILSQGGDVSSLDNVTITQHNENALHLATYNHHLDVVELLLKSGADPNLPNIFGISSKDLAESSMDSKLILLISKYTQSNKSEMSNFNSFDRFHNIEGIIKDTKDVDTHRGSKTKIIPLFKEIDLS